MARLAEAGCAVHVAVMAAGGIQHRHVARAISLKQRKIELAQAAATLGANSCRVLLPGQDMALDATPEAKLVTRLDQLLDTLSPQAVFLPAADTNVDHRVTRQAVMAALRITAGRAMMLVVEYETATGFWPGADTTAGSLYVDISAQLERKCMALACYKSQLRRPPHPVSLESVRARATVNGIACGRLAAERFTPLRIII